ncbi:hypothetical protein HC762_00485 [bacterium]|nr:hypothetical protein [bacterium]
MQIKNLSSLRSSDRRKLADQIIAQYQIPLPAPPAAPPLVPPPGGETLVAGPEHYQEHNPSTLAALRSALLPENCVSARFTTKAGPDSHLVSGTVFAGSHPDQDERILWFQIGQADQPLYPTVYSLWQNPGLVPLLHTQAFVVEKLRAGADLMTPGLARGPPFPEKAKKGAVVAVASIDKASVPVFVGVCKIDVSALTKVQGLKGHAVTGLHWEGDELWAWSSSGGGGGGRLAPPSIGGWDRQSDIRGLSQSVETMKLDENDADDVPEEDGGVPLEQASLRIGPARDGSDEEKQQFAGETEERTKLPPEPSTQEVDQVFFNAFLYAIYNARKSGSPPQYEMDLPVNPSFLISNLIQPHFPIFPASLAPSYTIKKTSWKNTKKFVKHLDKQGLVKSKDRSGGETVIVDIDFDDERVLDFTPYRLSKRGGDADPGSTNPSSRTTNDGASSDPSINQHLSLQILIRPSPKLVPDLLPSKTDFYTPSQVSSFLRTYLDQQHPELTAESSSPRFVKLNPFIANNILNSHNQGGGGGGTKPAVHAAVDTKALAAGEIARDVLQKRVLEDNHLCQPYWLLLHGDQKWPPPPPPSTDNANAVEVSGVVRVGNDILVIVKAPNEPTSRYIRVGQRIAGGQVLVKRVDFKSGADPVVVLEENGVEVAKAVGEKLPMSRKSQFNEKFTAK